MNNNQLKKISMYGNVYQFVDSHMKLLSGKVPIFSSSLTNFSPTLAELKALIPAATADTTVYTRNKNELRKILNEKIGMVANMGLAYGSVINDKVLQSKFRYTKSDIIKMGDVNLYTNANLIMNEIAPIAKELEQYGLSGNMISELNTLIEDFIAIMPAHSQYEQEKAYANETAEKLIEEMDKKIKDIDLLMNIIEQTDTDLYDEYEKGRTIEKD